MEGVDAVNRKTSGHGKGDVGPGQGTEQDFVPSWGAGGAVRVQEKGCGVGDTRSGDGELEIVDHALSPIDEGDLCVRQEQGESEPEDTGAGAQLGPGGDGGRSCKLARLMAGAMP